MSGQTRVLLDKNVIRRYLDGVIALVQDIALSDEEKYAVLLVHRARQRKQQLFLSVEAFNLLLVHRQIAPAETMMLLKRTDVLHPGRYCRRWARRLRGRTFSREDAKVLALGTFGTDEAGTILGVHIVATYDRPLLAKWTQERDEIADHLQAMTENLPFPFARAGLPDVLRPGGKIL
ncbi:MAG TPA: hypothetical protein ENJ31_00490 [Anaerolineae bacterium]|nr:hypothetical protein [Anaerolineae bacterium]